MKRVPIFKLSTSTLFQTDHKLEILTHGITTTPTIVSSNNNNSGNGTPTKSVTPTLSSTLSATTTTTTNENESNTFDHFCNTCLLRFTDKEIRNVHYRSGLHRYNLNLRLSNLLPVTEEDYNILIENIKSHKAEDGINENGGDESDDSGYSSSESDDYSSSDEENTLLKKNKQDQICDEEYYYKTQGYQFYDSSVEMNDPKLKIIQKDLKLQLSVWKCLLGPPTMFKQLSIAPEGSDVQKSLLDQLVVNFKSYVQSKDLKWVVLLCSGGRFAGAVYSGGKCIDHKTFHRYTMRKKQGGAQSTKDSQSGNKKSAGAGMRRYNEKRLKEEVAELLELWRSHFKDCCHVFIFAPKGNTRDILFPPTTNSNVPLHIDDERIRVIPFPIIRPTFSEAQRVSTWISSVDIELFDEEKLELEKKEQERKQQERQDKIDYELKLKEKERKRVEYLEKQKQQDVVDEQQDEISIYESNQLFKSVRDKDYERVKYLLEQDDQFEMPIPNLDKKEMLITPLFIAMENQDVKMVSYLLKQLPTDINLLNPRWDFKTSLHKAAMDGNCDLIEVLLNNGADPTLTSGLSSLVPYDSSVNQKTRDKFREWAGDHCETSSWDFSKAHIVPLTKQMKQEKEEKQRQKRKQQREKEKVKKQQEKLAQEQQEQQAQSKKDQIEDLKLVDQLQRSKLSKDSQLSDREKRALAAERRSGGDSSSSGYKSCDFCNHPIIGTPFERLTFKYCNTQCVLFHKKQLEK